jgi:hypothetical protein
VKQASQIVDPWRRRSKYARAIGVLALVCPLALIACQRARGVDTQPLNQSGMAYDSVKQLESLKITSGEVAQVLTARSAGFSDVDCVQIVRTFHERGEVFDGGSAVAGLLQAGMSDDTILELAKLNQLGLSAGEFEAMHLAGLSDAIILELARHRADGKPALSGATLARLKNTGMRASTLLELAHRGIPDSEAPAIISYRRQGASDAEILRRFPGS